MGVSRRPTLDQRILFEAIDQLRDLEARASEAGSEGAARALMRAVQMLALQLDQPSQPHGATCDLAAGTGDTC